MSTHVETKSIESKLLVALIVIRNSAFFDWIFLKQSVRGYSSAIQNFWPGQNFCIQAEISSRNSGPETENLARNFGSQMNSPSETGISEISRHEDKKSMVSKLFIALIVKRNSAFF